MGRVALGFLFGLLCAGLLHGPGAGLLDVPAIDPGRGSLAAGVVLAVAAGSILFMRRSLAGEPVSGLLLGAALGVGLEGIPADLRPGNSLLTPLAPIALVLLLLRERKAVATQPGPPCEKGFTLPLAGAGLGIWLLLAPLERTVLRFGGGTYGESALTLTILLALAAFGGLAFGAPLRGEGGDRAGSRAALVAALATGPAVVLEWYVLAGQVFAPLARRDLLARFGLDRSQEGEFQVTAVVALVGLLLPAFTLGLALRCARRRRELAALVGGGAVGALALGLAPELPAGKVGALALVVAGSLALLLTPRAGTRAGRWAIPAALPPALITTLALWNLHPPPVLAWERFPRDPLLLLADPAGQLLVKPGAPGVEEVLLDRIGITPRPERAAIDAEELRVALSLARARPRVLLVGQLTPGRALVLAEAGATRIDRCASWWRSMPALEEFLFRNHQENLPAEGEVLTPGEAHAALARGDYDLALVPAVTGGAPRPIPTLDPPEGTLVVAWYDGGGELAERNWHGSVLLATDGLDQPTLGLAWGTTGPFQGGTPTPAPKLGTYAHERSDARARRARTALLQRLAQANPEDERLAGLALHYAAQEPSSPWASRAEATELDPQALSHLLAAAAETPPDRLTRGIWDGIALVLMGKRDIEGIWQWVEPVSRLWPDWTLGELALAQAEIESLELDRALELLEKIGEPPEPAAMSTLGDLRRRLGEALRAAGREEEAAALLQGAQGR